MTEENKMEQTQEELSTSLQVVSQKSIQEIVQEAKKSQIVKKEDAEFFLQHRDHLAKVEEKTFMWRTDMQKESIINDHAFPTIHAKFHQCILEQKVQFEQAMLLVQEYETLKLNIRELECDLEELDIEESEILLSQEDPQLLNSKEQLALKRIAIKKEKLQRELVYKQNSLYQQEISWTYRMKEIKGWQAIEERLMATMKTAGLSDEEIWTKDFSETENLFFYAMNNLQGLSNSSDAGEVNNLVYLASFAYDKAKQAGILDKLILKATPIQKSMIQQIELFRDEKNTNGNYTGNASNTRIF